MKYRLIKNATNSEPTKSSYSDDLKQSHDVYCLGPTNDFYITEYAFANETGWYALKASTSPEKDDYERIIEIHDICAVKGAKTLWIKEGSLNKDFLENLFDNAKYHHKQA